MRKRKTKLLNNNCIIIIIFLYILYIKFSSIYIKAKVSGWLCVWLNVFVCMLLGSGGLLLCSGGVFFGVRSGDNDIFDIYNCCYAAGAFSLGSVLGPLLDKDLGSVLGLFLGNDSRQVVFSLLSCCWAAAQQWGGIHGRGKMFLFSTKSRPVLGPTQPPIQWVPGALSRGVKTFANYNYFYIMP
jgi:hypothetical protein